MAMVLKDISRTFNEFLLVPNLTDERCIPENVSLKSPLVKFKKGEEPKYSANVPFVSAIMQAVSGEKMAIALAREGGCSFIFGSQSIESQAQMVRNVKKYKAGFITSDSNVKEDTTIRELLGLIEETGHSTVMITEDGTPKGKFLGLVTDKDFRISRVDLESKVSEYMVPKEKIVCAHKGVSLHEANDIIWDNKISCLPIIDDNGNLDSLVFRKDYESDKENPNSLLDENKRFVVGAGINTRDYEKRIPALVEAGVDLICMDSSDGYSVWQKNTIDWVRKNYGDSVKSYKGIEAYPYKVKYEYAGKEYIAYSLESVSASYGNFPSKNLQREITVYFKKDKPEVVTIKEFNGTLIIGTIFLILGILGIII